jgi:hypothetical protein
LILWEPSSGTSPTFGSQFLCSTKNMTELWLMNCLRITGSYLKNFRGIFIKFYKKKLKTFSFNRSKVFDVSLFGILSHNHPTNIQNKKLNEIFIIKNLSKKLFRNFQLISFSFLGTELLENREFLSEIL